jgi:hypothetical protein
MNWNFRIVKDKDGVFSMGEAYYNEDKSVWGITEKESPQGDDVDDLIENLEMLLADAKRCKEDVIDMGTFKLTKPDFEDEVDKLDNELSKMTEAELDDYCLKDELNMMDHPEFDFVKTLDKK